MPVDTPSKFTFKAGSEPDDKGTIGLEQISVRGIGRKTVEFTVKPQDYRVTVLVAAGGLTATKCDGHEGAWTIASTGAGTNGTMTFTFPEGSTSAEVHAVYDLSAGGGTPTGTCVGRSRSSTVTRRCSSSASSQARQPSSWAAKP